MTDAIYCPYSDMIIELADKNQWSLDHIVPLFMGGSDLFQIRCSRRANNDIGSRIEAPMQNDFLLSLALRNAGITGRRGTTTVPEWKHSLVEGSKTHIRLGLDQVTFWDKVGRHYADLSDRDVVPIKTRVNMDMFAPLRLGAKIVLGTMAFLFGHSAKIMFDMRPFQTLMYMQNPDELGTINPSLRVLQRHDAEALHPGSDAFNWKIMVESFGRTCIIVAPHTDGISIHLAIAGQFLASFQFDADTAQIPLDGLFDIAQVILLGPGLMERSSLRDRREEIMNHVHTLNERV